MPLIINRLKSLVLRHFSELKWYTLLAFTIFYLLSSWLLLWLANEKDLLLFHEFFYWIIVTGSTVGYGDLSPSSVVGKWLVALYIIPVGLTLFGLLLGRVITFVSHQWRRGVKGLSKLDYQDHIVVIGWNEARTLHLIKLLQHETSQSSRHQGIVLCVMADIEHPLPGEIGFVRVVNFTDDSDMARAGIAHANCIILDNPDDGITMTTALYVANVNPNAHIIAYFENEKVGELLKQHCPKIECAPSVSVEMMAKAAMDPGSSRLHHQLLNANTGMTQYSCVYDSSQPTTVGKIFNRFKEQFDVTLIALQAHESQELQVNPALDCQINKGCHLFYIAKDRLKSIDWDALNV